jgi:hypothetical protein
LGGEQACHPQVTEEVTSLTERTFQMLIYLLILVVISSILALLASLLR